MYILGISAFYHDSAACLLKNGEIVAAAQEERFTRKKHDAGFPDNAILYCLTEAAITADDIDHVVFYEKPLLKFDRILETYMAFAPKGFPSFARSLPSWVKDKLFQKSTLSRELSETLDNKIDWGERLLFSQHHLSHAASAFFASPFEKAAVLVLDGVGEWTSTSVALGNKNKLDVVKEIKFPHSLGLLYSAFTYFTGFKVNSGEYKLMGLAPYGNPRYVELIKKNLIEISADGSFRLNMRYFNYATGLTMTNDKFAQLFNMAPRTAESSLTQEHMDLAASIQKVTEEVVVKIGQNILEQTGERKLCLAGGVALNCVANGVLLRKKIFDEIWVQPAAGDAGGAVGAALGAWYLHLDQPRIVQKNKDSMRGSFLGPSYSDTEIEAELNASGAIFHKLEQETLLDEVVNALDQEKAVGWMQGRMEFGPRALGCRSIIADARSERMQKQLNLKVKFRESFRPFAPSILYEDVDDWFEQSAESPYMLFVADICENKRIPMTPEQDLLFGIDKLNVARSVVPAVTHVDYSARIQTVHRDTNPKYHALITKFKQKTGCPILVNTSFNVRGEPIVCSPSDAFKCFMGTDLDLLVIENFLLFKPEQNSSLNMSYKDLYELD